MASNGFSGFMKGTTAGLPNWGWVLVIGGGIAAVYLVPKFLGSKSSPNPLQQSADQSAAAGASGLGLAIDPTTGLPYAVEGLVPSGASGAPSQGVQGPPGQQGPTGPPGSPGPTGTNPVLPAGTKITYGPSGRVYYTTPGGQQQVFSQFKNGLNPSGGYAGFCPGCITQVLTNGQVNARLPNSNQWWILVPPSSHSSTRTPNEAARYMSVPAWPYGMTTMSAIASQHSVSLTKLLELNPAITDPNHVYAGQAIRIS